MSIKPNKKLIEVAVLFTIMCLIFYGLDLRGRYEEKKFYETKFRERVIKTDNYAHLSNDMDIYIISEPYENIQMFDSIIKEANTWNFDVYKIDHHDNYHFYTKYTYDHRR